MHKEKLPKADLFDKEHLLKRSDSFCLFPWIHLNANPNGEVFPCCTTEHAGNEPCGHLRDSDLTEIINSEQMKQLRLQMLRGEKPEICRRCHAIDDSGGYSYRFFANNDFAKHIDCIDSTNDDGSIDDFKMHFIDIRFSNQCNFKCATCGPVFSSAWIPFQPDKGFKLDRVSEFAKTDIIEQLRPHISEATEIYFAGGEPMIMEEHYQLLTEIRQQGAHDVKLRYNSNLSTLKFQENSIVELWKDFNCVVMGASLDGVGAVAETVRKGTRWNLIEGNIKKILPLNNVTFCIDTVISILNIDHLPDFYEYIFENSLIQDRSLLTINMLFTPVEFSLTSLPRPIKAELTQKLSAWKRNFNIKKYGPAVRKNTHIKQSIPRYIDSIISFMNSKDTFDRKKLEYLLSRRFIDEQWRDRLPLLERVLEQER